ncbi:hypothetical protein [Pseudonocardia spirodelae]|uniref:Uncharacterized protein n=1 Tax=Pseudonocardia spirodelae TaxID=3133431 RepID=A0ABU8T640_9PSEU
MDDLEQDAVDTTAAMLAEGGWVPPPTVHLLCAELPRLPYVGYLRSRPFYRGDDAHRAIAGLGWIASLTQASRVVLIWEQADLSIALQRPPSLPSGLVVLDAARGSEHEVRWHPMDLIETGTTPDGLPTAVPEWGPSRRIPGGRLPEPILDLLALWREERIWSEVRNALSCTSVRRAGFEPAT